MSFLAQPVYAQKRCLSFKLMRQTVLANNSARDSVIGCKDNNNCIRFSANQLVNHSVLFITIVVVYARGLTLRSWTPVRHGHWTILPH